MRAVLYLHQKKVFENGSVLEMKIWEVNKSKAYPDGMKYSLIFIDHHSGRKVLMDNHSPKGHHYHIDDTEHGYTYLSMNQLIEDFNSLVQVHVGVTL